MIVFLTENNSPIMNLAIESWLYNRTDLYDQDLLFLYRNRPSVIIGRFQNPWLECDLKKMRDHNILFARRQSGGGAVYHDMGNTNFTFISSPENFNKDNCTNIIIKALQNLGVGAEQGSRNDIYVHGMKISGSASKYSSKRVLHHGTLLINADLHALNSYLITMDYKTGAIKSKGIASIPSKVVNLQEFDKTITHERVCKTVIEEVSIIGNEQPDITVLNNPAIKDTAELENLKTEMSSWNWLFGQTPSFTVAVPLISGALRTECLISITRGIVSDIQYADRELESGSRELPDNIYKGMKCDQLLNIVTIL